MSTLIQSEALYKVKRESMFFFFFCCCLKQNHCTVLIKMHWSKCHFNLLTFDLQNDNFKSNVRLQYFYGDNSFFVHRKKCCIIAALSAGNSRVDSKKHLILTQHLELRFFFRRFSQIRLKVLHYVEWFSLIWTHLLE